MSNDGSVLAPEPGSEPTAEPTAEREQWVDIAKGGAIVLVLLHHTWETLVMHRTGLPLWGMVDQSLASMRMPTFFMVSGLFAAKAVSGPFTRIRDHKLALFGYLYALWSAFYVAFYAAKTALEGGPVGPAVQETALQALTLNSKLWYLPALAIFFALAFALRRLPPAAQLALAAAALVPFALRMIETHSWGLDRMAQYYFWFLVGCYGSARIRKAAERSTWLITAVLGLAWVAVGVTMLKILGRGWHFGDLLLPFFAVPFAVAASVVVARWTAARPLAFLGRSTLPVYVLHDAMIIVAIVVLPCFGQVLNPPLITIAATCGCVALARILRTQWYLFRLPAFSGPGRA